MKKTLLAALTISTALSTPALAASTAEMEARIKQLEAKLAKFESVLGNVDTYINKKVSSEIKEKQASDVEVTLKPAPSFKTKDGSTSFALDGRIIVDAAMTNSDKANIQGSATDVRYAWLGAKGTIDHDWAYRFLIGLENDATNINDLWIAYNGFNNASIKIGNYKEFQGIEAMSGNLHNTLQERSVGTPTFRSLRSLGLSASFYGDQWSLHTGVFGDDPGNTDADEEAHSFTGRFVYAPILDKSKDHVLHLGTSASYRVPDRTDERVRFNARGDSNIVNATLVDTGFITNVEDYITYAGEARYTYGPFSLMSEYTRVDLNRDTGADASFDGYYLTASYFLTGEQRSYNVKSGTYGRVKPKKPFSLKNGGTGAWEIAGRYTNLDLNDDVITGGELDSYTLGLNWYPTNNVKFMLNYIMNDTDGNASTPYDSPDYVTFRAQLDF